MRVDSPEAAWTAAQAIGLPVVLKPLDGNHGRGVILDNTDEADVRAAFEVAKAESRRGVVLVESQIVGKDYRCLIIDGRVAAIAERELAPGNKMTETEVAINFNMSAGFIALPFDGLD